MKNILNYKLTPHFEERLIQRQIDPFLVSMCLVKGDIKMMKKNKIEFTLSKYVIKQAILQGYIQARECLGITSLTVVVRKNILITTFAKFGDTGIAN